MKIIAHPEFGKELRRPFNVAEECYDCAEFFDGCGAWPASKAFACGMVDRLPDVMSGACGQMLPPSRVTGSNSVHTDAVFEIAKPKAATWWAPASLNRLCGCGATLPKHKRLCEPCRVQRRRETKREYMRAYMGQRRSAVVEADSDLPPFVATTHATHARAGNLPSTGKSGRGCPKNRNFCTNKPH